MLAMIKGFGIWTLQLLFDNNHLWDVSINDERLEGGGIVDGGWWMVDMAVR